MFTDMSFDATDIDFGCCTIHEAVKKTVNLTNHSILSQQFGFIGLPEVICSLCFVKLILLIKLW